MTGDTCPDFFELSDGNFAVIGTDATDQLEPELPADAARAKDERIIIVSRDILILATSDIPDA
ncbi:hypothetical protein [Streptomyces sp. NPDC051636]|uniref:hypothetical protein n=1 Tax=Streptomyces sp. NPDC051636 TaxID=3365663 RepID=UPI003795E6B1